MRSLHTGRFALFWMLVVICMSWSVSRAQVQLVLQPGSRISTLAGSGTDARTSAGNAIDTALGAPRGLVYDSSGNLYVADARNHQVDRVEPSGKLSVIAGTGVQGFAGDGSAAIAAELNTPSAVALDKTGNLYIADSGNHRIRRVTQGGTIATVAGTGFPGFYGDGAAATSAMLRAPSGLAVNATGELLIADTSNHRVRKLRFDGTIVTIAGTGVEGDSGDGGDALQASLESPVALTVLADGTVLIADRTARRVRALQMDGNIAAYVSGITMRRPEGLAVDASGSMFVADSGNQAVSQSTNDGSSVLAGGTQGALTIGTPTATALDSPSAVATGSGGDVAISDRRNHQVQRITLPQLAFGSVPAGRVSAVQTVQLKNGGGVPLQVIALTLPSGFLQTVGTTCGTPPFTLQAAGQCSVTLAFAPMIQGLFSGLAAVRISGAAPQSLLLTGAATAGDALASSSTTLQTNGSISYVGAPVTFTATVTGSLAATPTGNVVFNDGTSAIGTVALSANGTATLATAALTGGTHSLHASYSGDSVYSSSTSSTLQQTVAPAPDFTMSATSASFSGKAGGSIVIPLTMSPVAGTLNQPLQLNISGLPSGATAAFSPTAMVLAGNPLPVTLTVQLPATLASDTRQIPVAVAAFFFSAFVLRRRRLGKYTSVLALVSLMTFSGCGGGYRGGSTSSAVTDATTHTYMLTITATTTGVLGTPLVHSMPVTLVVSP